jgi:oleandomycin transport system ATP-binding protein
VSAVAEITRSTPEVVDDLVTAQVISAAALPAVVRRLDDAEVDVAELALRTSTLDEVFLSLTGHHTDATEEVPA